MKIEEEIFKRCHVCFEKLEPFGFQKIGDTYRYSLNFFDDNFRADIMVDSCGHLSGQVIDLQMGDEYTNIRVTTQVGSFVSKVRKLYQDILIHIKEQCFDVDYFLFEQANRICGYINHTYHDMPEFLWEKFSGYGVFRNARNGKWYAIIMNINISKIDHGNGEVEILNIKLNCERVKQLLGRKGFYPAYHMNKKDWITILLDHTLDDNEIICLLDESYKIVNETK